MQIRYTNENVNLQWHLKSCRQRKVPRSRSNRAIKQVKIWRKNFYQIAFFSLERTSDKNIDSWNMETLDFENVIFYFL